MSETTLRGFSVPAGNADDAAGGARKMLGCSSRTCNKAVRGDVGLDTLRSRRNKAKLKWWYK